MSAERKLRVLLFPSAYYPHVGGIEEIARQLAVHLQGRGHEACVVTNRWPDGTSKAEALGGVRVRRESLALPALSPRSLVRFALAAPRSAAALVRLARRFDVVHVVGAGPNGAYAAALHGLVPPIVLTLQGELRADPHRSFERSASLRFGLRRLLARAEAVTACSQFVLDELRHYGFTAPADARVVFNGVTADDFAEPRPEGTYVLAAARLVEQKGLDTLLRAYAAARSELGGRRLVIAGEGPERPALEALAARLGLNGHVSFPGAVSRSEVAELLRGADAFAFPSRYEPFGIALLEAMAAGVPAVATAYGGIPEFAVDGENALLVPVDDADALASALIRVTHDRALASRLATAGRQRSDLLSWEALTTRYEDIYRSVA